jgi:ABC-type nitrate/sulfonate/bicarbonate transport system substrate-binding protein
MRIGDNFQMRFSGNINANTQLILYKGNDRYETIRDIKGKKVMPSVLKA